MIAALFLLTGHAAAQTTGPARGSEGSAAPQAFRTIINGETAPLIYAVVDARVAEGLMRESGRESGRDPDPEEIVAFLRSSRVDLDVLPPDGAWRVQAGETLLVGYYGGGPSAVAYRLVMQRLRPGSAPVLIDRRSFLVVDGNASRIEPWEVPDRSDPVTLDGLAVDWSGVVPLVTFAPGFAPTRIEDAQTGVGFALSASQLWPAAGLALSRLSARRVGSSLYLLIEPLQTPSLSTSYHLTLFGPARRAPALGEIVIPIRGVSGPVIQRGSEGEISLAGSVTHRAGVVEVRIDLPLLPVAMQAAMETGSWDLASVAEGPEMTERATLATVYAVEVPSR